MHHRETETPRSETSELPWLPELRAVEIFGGAGGLALGVAQAGFEHVAVIEVDQDACQTIRENQRSGNPLTRPWPLHEIDIRDFNYSKIDSEIDLLCAGVPCQPFSLAGKGMAHRDRRDMFSEVLRAVHELRPKAILIENVKGLLRPAFKSYFDYLLLALESPALARRRAERWPEHLASLKTRRPQLDGAYDVHVHSVNAADYGVPQWRERVLIVGFRSDLHVSWSLPEATHSLDALIWSQCKTGQYWKRHGLDRRRPGSVSRRFACRVKAARESEKLLDFCRPWKTVRDAISSLPTPRRGEATGFSNHVLIPGARHYPGHTGSLMDEPAKTLKAGSHGVPGGENALVLEGQRVRYFSVRECARLQTFPDDYIFAGAWTSAMRQVGNAVPVALAYTMAHSIEEQLRASIAGAKSNSSIRTVTGCKTRRAS